MLAMTCHTVKLFVKFDDNFTDLTIVIVLAFFKVPDYSRVHCMVHAAVLKASLAPGLISSLIDFVDTANEFKFF